MPEVPTALAADLREQAMHAAADPTFDEALASLQASLPENPDIDTAPQRALRVVVDNVLPVSE